MYISYCVTVLLKKLFSVIFVYCNLGSGFLLEQPILKLEFALFLNTPLTLFIGEISFKKIAMQKHCL